jgi:hypothetical protein
MRMFRGPEGHNGSLHGEVFGANVVWQSEIMFEFVHRARLARQWQIYYDGILWVQFVMPYRELQ